MDVNLYYEPLVRSYLAVIYVNVMRAYALMQISQEAHNSILKL